MVSFRRDIVLLAATVLLLCSTLVIAADLPPLIPRTVLFGNPDRQLPRLSPDGSQISWLAADKNGVMNVWARSMNKEDAKVITNESHRPIFFYDWAQDGKHILYLQDFDGDENYHLYSVDLESGNVRDLTPFRGVKAQNLMTSGRKPNEVLVALNMRDRKAFDLYRIKLDTGAVTVEAQNPGDVLTWATDNDFVVRGATAFDPKTAQSIVRVRDAVDQPWRDLVVMPFEKALFAGQVVEGSLIAAFNPDGKSIIIHSALNSDKGRLIKVDLQTGKELEIVAQDPDSDVADDLNSESPTVIVNPNSGLIEAVKFDYTTPHWKFLDETLGADFNKINQTVPGFIRLLCRDNADRHWIVSVSSSDTPTSYYAYDRDSQKVTELYSENPEFLKYSRAPKKPVIITARDGLKLVCYLTLPPNVDPHNLPMVMDIHGGPFFRDSDYFDPEIQMLANRGYAVLQVNYRGSTGFGLAYLNAGTKQWGLGMQEDIYNAAEWAIKQGIADPKRVAAMGWSGGGYATLRALSMRPDLFACGVDGVGPAEIAVLLRSFPQYWSAILTRWRLRIGDADHDDAWNRKISPLYHVDAIRAPLLIGQGVNDPRVTIENANMMVKALRDAKREVVYVVYPDEGHGFARPENNLDFFGRAEEFLGKHLGGRFEPWKQIEGSTAELR